jgi:hypothetical protein
MKLYLF